MLIRGDPIADGSAHTHPCSSDPDCDRGGYGYGSGLCGGNVACRSCY